MQLYLASDLLVSNQGAIEEALLKRINDLFSFPATVTLYVFTVA
jgi:hypothetical protein